VLHHASKLSFWTDLRAQVLPTSKIEDFLGNDNASAIGESKVSCVTDHNRVIHGSGVLNTGATKILCATRPMSANRGLQNTDMLIGMDGVDSVDSDLVETMIGFRHRVERFTGVDIDLSLLGLSGMGESTKWLVEVLTQKASSYQAVGYNKSVVVDALLYSVRHFNEGIVVRLKVVEGLKL
jgi:hypothetical protein